MNQVMDPLELEATSVARTTGSRRQWWILGVLSVVLALMLGGIAVVASRHPAQPTYQLIPSSHPHPEQLQYVIGDLPFGVTPRQATSAQQFAAPDGEVPNAPTTFYGTSGDPSAPRIWLASAGEEYVATSGYGEQRLFSVAGTTAQCGRLDLAAKAGVFPRYISCWVSTAGGIAATAEGLDLDTMQRLMERALILHGRPTLPADQLPKGMTSVLYQPAHRVPTYANATVTYQGSCYLSISLAVSWADEDELATTQAAAREWKRVAIGSTVGYLSDSPAAVRHVLVWTVDGRSFRLTVQGYADLLRLARSVRPASAAEWEGFSAPAAPTPPMPEPDTGAVVHSVPVTQVLDTSAADVAALIARSASGGSSSISIRNEQPLLAIVGSDHEQVWHCAPPAPAQPVIVPVGASVVDGLTRASGVVAISSSPSDTTLNVLATDGSRYDTTFVMVPGGSNPELGPKKVYVAYVPLTAGAVVSAQVVDRLGKVTAKI